MPESDTVVFVPHSGRDPEELQMQADTYGFKVVWPERRESFVRPVVRLGTPAQALGAADIALGVVLVVVRLFLRLRVVAKRMPHGVALVCGLVLAWSCNSFGADQTITSLDATLHIHFAVGSATWTATGSGAVSPSPWEGWIQVVLAASNGGTVGTQVCGYSYGGTGPTAGGSFSVSPGQWYAYRTGQKFGGSFQNVSGYVYFDSNPPPTYKITFHLPANTSGGVIHYSAIQSGVTLASTTTGPGDPAQDWLISGLTSQAPVLLMIMQSVTEFGEDPLNPGHIIQMGQVNGTPAQIASGIPTTGGSTVSGGNSPGPAQPIVPPINITPANPAPPTPAPNPGPAPRPPLVPPNTPSGTAGATKADLEKQTNDLITGINEVVAGNTASAGSVIAAINGQMVADTANTKTLNTGINGIVTELGKLRGDVEAENGTGYGGSGISTPDPATGTSQIDFSQDGGAHIIGALPVAPTFSSVTTTSVIQIAFSIPSPGHADIVVNKSVDFSQPPYTGPISIFRGCLLVVVTVGFYFAAFWTIRGAVAGK